MSTWLTARPAHRSLPSTGMRRSLAVALLVHAVVLAILTTPAAPPRTPPEPRAIELTIEPAAQGSPNQPVAEHPPETQAEPPPEPAPPITAPSPAAPPSATRPVTRQPHFAPRSVRPPPPPSAGLDRQPSVTPPSQPAAPALADATGAWRGALAAWLQSHKTYPDAARRDGVEGRAVVRFTLDATGAVLAVALVTSSGSPALDEAALTLLRGARLPPPPLSAAGMIAITLPVRYRLEH